MIENKVVIEGINYQTIEEMTFSKGVNEHGRATIKCFTDKKELKEIISDKDGLSWVCIKIGQSIEGSANKAIFTGIIETISLENCESIEEMKRVIVTLVEATYLLDIKKQTHVLQSDDTKLSAVKKHIKKDFGKLVKGISLKINNGNSVNDSEQPESELLVQYAETDYEFLRRVASMINKPLISEVDSSGKPGVSLCIGLRDKAGGNIDSKIYRSEKNMLNALVDQKLGVKNVTEKDYQTIEVRTREYFELGSKVQIDGKNLYVYSVKSMWGVKKNSDKADFIDSSDNFDYSTCVFNHVYKLAEEKRFNVPRIYNEKMVGTSIGAKVVKVEKEKLKIKCDCNKDKSSNEKNFLFASIYTSEDGTGWYCMPEEKDKVRLYMPTEDEKDAYVISSVHLEGGTDRDNPDVKFIRNKFKKEVRFEEKRLKITNNDGMDIIIDDNKGITILSNKNVCLSSKKDVTLLSKSGKMDLSGNKEVLLKQGGSSSVEFQNKVTFKAPNIKM